MTRLANSAKAGYFPIPPAVTDLITTYITAPQNGRILDPCAGEGNGDLLNSLSKNRPIPGLNGQTGLLPAQKHAAAAALTRLETHPDVIVVGEMGQARRLLGLPSLRAGKPNAPLFCVRPTW